MESDAQQFYNPKTGIHPSKWYTQQKLISLKENVQEKKQSKPNEKKNLLNSQSFSSQVSNGRRDRSNDKQLDQRKGLYTKSQVKEMMKAEELEKVKLLQTNYQLKKQQTIDFVKNDNHPMTSRHSESKNFNKFSEEVQAQVSSSHKEKPQQSRNHALNILDTGDKGLSTNSKQYTIQVTSVEGEQTYSSNQKSNKPSSRHSEMPKAILPSSFQASSIASNGTMLRSYNGSQNAPLEASALISQRSNGQQTQKRRKEEEERQQTGEFMGTAYNLSQQFYEIQYKDKLKELQVEKKKRKAADEKVEDLEVTLRDLMEEHVKLKDELQNCIADNNILSQHFQQSQEQTKSTEPYTAEVEDRNTKLNLELFALKEDYRSLFEERNCLQKKNNGLLQQIDDILKENKKWKDQHDQIKERMSSLRAVNKQLESKADKNWVMLRRNDIFKENEDRMTKAEARVKELEESLEHFIEDFETLNNDLTICAQKLTLTESRVEYLTKQNQEVEKQNQDLLEKIAKVRKPPPKTVKVNLCAHYEGQGKFNSEDLMKQLETQNSQILNLSKTLEGLRKENREYFQKTLEQQETIFYLQQKLQGYSGSGLGVSGSEVVRNLIGDQAPLINPSEDSSQIAKSRPVTGFNNPHISLVESSHDNEMEAYLDSNRGSNTVRSAVKEFSFKQCASREEYSKVQNLSMTARVKEQNNSSFSIMGRVKKL